MIVQVYENLMGQAALVKVEDPSENVQQSYMGFRMRYAALREASRLGLLYVTNTILSL